MTLLKIMLMVWLQEGFKLQQCSNTEHDGFSFFLNVCIQQSNAPEYNYNFRQFV